MLRFIGRRALTTLVTLLAVPLVVFGLSRLGGDPRVVLLGEDVTRDQWEAFGKELGLDRPVVTQYFIYVGRVLRGDLGKSVLQRKSVAQILRDRIPNSVQLALGAFAFSVLAGVPLGVLAVVTLVSGGAFGTVLGLVSGYAGGWVDEVIMRITDIKFSLPLILIALALKVVLGGSLGLLLGLLAFLIWGSFARQARGEVLKLKEMDYVKLAKVAGASPTRILYRHIFPGVFNTLMVIATLQVGSVILAEASLSFLGAGVPPPTPSWGCMVAEGRLYINTAWWVSLIPGLVIGLSVLSFTFLGDWLRDKLDPRLRQL